MKAKTFVYDFDKLEVKMNEWLKEKPDIKIVSVKMPDIYRVLILYEEIVRDILES